MKRTIILRLIVLLVALMASGTVATAYDFEEGGIYYNVNDDGASVTVTFESTSYNSYSGDVVIPNFVTHDGVTYTVTAIGDYAFMQSPDLTGIVISDSVKTVGRWVFRNCMGLKNVTIGKSITTLRYKKGSISYYAFQDCDSITSLTWNAVNCADNGNMVTTNIEQVTFGPEVQVIPPNIAKESKISEVVIPNSVTTIGSSAFANCQFLENAMLGNSVTSIGSSAFSNCELLESIVILDAVTSIGSSAFGGCSSLTHVTLGNSVTTIGKSAFANCYNLRSIDIPNSVITIGSGAFGGCTSLTYVNMGNSVTSIGVGAFYDCKGIEEITIPNSVTQIGSGAFYGCDYLTKVNISSIEAWCCIQFENYSSDYFINEIPTGTSNPLYYAHHLYLNGQEITDLVIPESVTAINNYAFYGGRGFTSVFLGDSVISIGQSAFQECTGLTRVTLGNSISTIDWSAFNGCTNLTSLTISKSVIHIENFIENCPSLTSLSVESGNPVYDSRDNCNAIIETATNTLVIGCQTTVIPNSVTSIGGAAFFGCRSLTRIDIPNSVTYIGNGAFYDCTDLLSVTIGYSVDSIGSEAFYGCLSLYRIEIPNSVTTIGDNAFYGCRSLTGIEIPNSVTTIGNQAFYNCSELMSAHIGNSVTSIGIWPFGSCPKLASITVESGNPVFDSRDNCNAIIETATNTLKFGCYTTVIPNTVTIIGDDSFAYCENLTSIDIPNSITSIGSEAFWLCDALTNIHIPNSVTAIGGYAFGACVSLKEVTIPNTVIASKSYTATGWFDNCWSLERVTIGSGIAYMGVMFWKCPNITSVTCLGTTPPRTDAYSTPENGRVTNFDDVVYGQATLYVPISALDAYKTAAYWKNFQDIRALGDTDGDGTVNIADVAELIDHLLSGIGNGIDKGAADVDGDGSVTIADVADLIDTLLNL